MMIHLIWLIPVIMIVVIIAATGWKSQFSLPNIKCKWPWILGILIILLLVFLYKGCSLYKENAKENKKGMKNILVCKNENGKWVKIPTGYYKEKSSGECVEGTPPQPAQSQATTTYKRKSRALYIFLPDGCLPTPKYLQGDWGDYPKGGKITFQDSTGKVVFEDEPGKLTGSKLPPGNYKICSSKKDPGAWGVEIWE